MFHKTGWGIFRQYMAGLSCTISMFVVGTAVGWPSPTIPKLQSPNSQVANMKGDALTWMVSILYIGNMVSPLPSGYLMDRFGRKFTVLALTTLPLASWVIVLYASNPVHLYIARFLSGIHFGVVYTIIPIYLAEIAEPNIRGSLGTFTTLWTYGGVLFEYSIGPYVSYKTLATASLMIPIVFVVLFSWMPESPHYLVMKGKNESAIDSLKWLRCSEKDRVEKELDSIKEATELEMKSGGNIRDLFATKGTIKALIIVQALAIFQRSTGIGPLMAFSLITIPPDSIPGINVKECALILAVVWFMSALISSLITDQFERKRLLIVSALGCGSASFAAATWFYLHEKTQFDVKIISWIPYLSFLIHAIFYSSGMGPIAISIKGELFPANIKAKSSAITSMVFALVSFILNKIYISISDSFGIYLNFIIFGVSSYLCVIFVVGYVIETKGKTLQDIQHELNN